MGHLNFIILVPKVFKHFWLKIKIGLLKLAVFKLSTNNSNLENGLVLFMIIGIIISFIALSRKILGIQGILD